MSLATVSNSDWAALNLLIGQAMLYDDVRSKLLKQHTRKEALDKSNLSLGLWLRIMSIEDTQDLHDLAERLVMLIRPPDTLM
jgi:hypothetical protein